MPTTTVHLTDRIPRVSADELLAGFRPSERFGEVSFDSYIPDPNQPSQAEAVQKLKDFGDKINGGGAGAGFFGRLFGGKKKDSTKAVLCTLTAVLVWVRLTCWRRCGIMWTAEGVRYFCGVHEPGGCVDVP